MNVQSGMPKESTAKLNLGHTLGPIMKRSFDRNHALGYTGDTDCYKVQYFGKRESNGSEIVVVPQKP
jgi:hypothetical protein